MKNVSETPCCGNNDREASFTLCSSFSSLHTHSQTVVFKVLNERKCNADETFDDSDERWSERECVCEQQSTVKKKNRHGEREMMLAFGIVV